MFHPIAFDEFRNRSDIGRSDLVRGWENVERVISLRQMAEITDVRVMPRDYLYQLLTRVPLKGNGDQVYKECDIRTARIDPSTLLIGQTFVERRKYRAFLETFQDAFDNFCVTRGVAKCTALITFGFDAEGRPSIAHYLPPIIEIHGGSWRLLDGVHRNFLVKMVGTTLESIIIGGVSDPFPCGVQRWEQIDIVSEKPPKDERFIDLRPPLFRDLKHIGIDG